MRFLESDTKQLLKENGIKVLDYYILKNFDNAKDFVNSLQGEQFFLRPHTYERGKERFGEVVIASSKEDAIDKVKVIVEEKLTALLSEKKLPVTEIIFEEAIPYKKVFYLSLFFDGSKAKTVFLISKRRLMPKDFINQEGDDHIVVAVDFAAGFSQFIARKICFFLDMDNEAIKKAINNFKTFYVLFLKFDLKFLNMGPVYLSEENEIIISGAHMIMDQNSVYRHLDMLKLATDKDELQDLEWEAYRNDISYVMFDGDIGCLVNGTGIGLALVDLIRHKGGDIAAFVDVGGAASKDRVKKALSIMLKDKHIKLIFINFFNGMVKSDEIAEGLVEALDVDEVEIPIVVRIDGINKVPALKLLAGNSKITLFDDLSESVAYILEKVKQKSEG